MPWYLDNMDMVDAMADIARDPEKLKAYKDDPYTYLQSNTELDDDVINAMTHEEPEAITRALLGKVDTDGKGKAAADGDDC